MKPFETYSLYPISIVKGSGAYIFDETGKSYLDCYGGHGVISVGHAHPEFVQAIQSQVEQLTFYSNSVKLPLQTQLAKALGEASNYDDYAIFFCNSGAESNEHALTLALEHTGRKKILAFNNGFHGRSMGAAHLTQTAKKNGKLFLDEFSTKVPINDIELVEKTLEKKEFAAVIIEGIQGVGGLDMPSESFLSDLRKVCYQTGTLLILDEIQSGYGRTGKFFAHQYAGIKADLITVAKGMGNGFPIGGVLIHPDIKPKPGLLGTTFGGNPLACAAGIAVLEIMKKEDLIQNVLQQYATLCDFFQTHFPNIPLKGKGLMFGVELDFPIASLRSSILMDHGIFTGNSAQANVMRILPPLSITRTQILQFLTSFQTTYHAEISINS